MFFPHLPESSKVWIYQSQTKISLEVHAKMKVQISLFISGWAAHGNELFGAGEIIDDYFVVFAVDESKVMASGCSIDTLVHFVRKLGQDFQLDFFNRLNLLIIENGKQKIVHFNELSNYSNSIVYNPLVQTLGEMNNSWKIKVSESQFA